MNTKRMLAVAVAGIFALAFADLAMARGGNGQGKRNGGGNQSSTRTQAQCQTNNTTSTTRPADSQRRDGTFLTTGVTANGSTTRPANGNGLRDGSGANAAPVQ